MWGFFFGGQGSIAATIDHLARTAGLGDATDVLLVGASAGGIGVNNNCDWFGDEVRAHARTRSSEHGDPLAYGCAPLSGMFFPPNTTAEWQERVIN